MDNAFFIRFKTMPLDKEVEGRHRPPQAHLEVAPHLLHHFLEMIHQRQHREHGLDYHPRVPRPARAQFEILRITLFGMIARVGKAASRIEGCFEKKKMP
jgi:hypothetical protein